MTTASEAVLRLSPAWLGLLVLVLLVQSLALVWAWRRTRQRHQAALDSGEAYMRSMVETAPDAIVATRADGTIEWANQASASVFGLAPNELRGRHITLVLPGFAECDVPAWMAAHGIAGRVLGHETQGARVDGTRFPIAVSASATTERRGDRYTFVVRDTTDSKWAEQELHLRERALESAGDGIVITSMELPGGPIIFANPAFYAMTGYGPDEVIGSNAKFLLGDDQHQSEIEETRRAVAEKRGCRVVLRNYRKDGSLFWNLWTLSPVFRSDGEVTHYVSVFADITARMAQEEALRLRTERLNTVFDLSPDGFVAVDPECVVRMVNPSFAAMTGIDPAEVEGQPLTVLAARLSSLLDTTVRRTLDAVELLDASREDLLLQLRQPVPRTLLTRVRQSEAGQEAVLYFRDITHELEVDRMKSEFLSMAAHELRTPMASIYGFTELLLHRTFGEERRRDMLTTIHRQTGLLVNLVNELLDLARIEERRGKDFQRRVLALAPLVERHLAGMLVPDDPRKVQVDLTGAPIWVDVDEVKLCQALANVLTNAYKYSPREQPIALSLAHRGKESDAQVGLRVTDRGIGMTPEQQARLFERFFRADTSGNVPGTGLGMTIVKEIVELHGGVVEVRSEYQRGTEVTLWLPTVAAPALALPALPEASAASLT